MPAKEIGPPGYFGLLVGSLPLLSDFCCCARRFGLGFLLCGIPLRLTFVLLSLALADKVVATRHGAGDLFDFALDTLDYSLETLFRTTIVFTHSVSPRLVSPT
ncbi:hypothetical protein TL10_14075 [Mycolicibacterium llatzerense]|uniref:Uncharacterized protein n=1 Tax=Mycolicibacterium llatzerense TaxID=280871 RepID=A0A0D1J3T2_9MYCO|nr:hypothetical protein TL10_14075 [Mycolicibacterium llatzerense]MCT7367985.1 hypothetical protein [Mycolicibacterium llatzerense]